MKRALARHVAIWIDGHQAVLLRFEAGTCDRSAPHSRNHGCAHNRVAAHQYPNMQQYYEAVLSHLKPQDEILIVGPRPASDELCQRIEQRGNLKGKVVGLQHAPKLAAVELVFPTGVAWRSDTEGAAQLDPPLPLPVLGFPEKPPRL